MKNLRQMWVLLPMILLILVELSLGERMNIRSMTVGAALVLLLNLLPLLIFSTADAMKNPTRGAWAGFFRASFYAYLFMVLALTLYWVDYGSLSLRFTVWREQWRGFSLLWNSINFRPFRVFRDYGTPLHPQILGNFVMLAPLGVYIPSLFPKHSSFLRVMLIGLACTVSIELLQLVITHLLPLSGANPSRSVDVDDVILNTAGVLFGYLLYRGTKGGGGGRR